MSRSETDRPSMRSVHTSIRSMGSDPVGASCMQSVKFRSVISPLLFHARARGRRVGQLEAPAGKIERSSQARFGGLTLVSRAPWLLVTGAPGLFSWPNTLWNTAVACRMSPTSRTGQAAASRRHRHRNAEARPARGRGPPTHAWMLHDWLTVDLNEMLHVPAADLNIIIFETD